ncbi:UDP-glucose 4-epimerase GalE [Candidatus Pelagibacter sp.]|nr:UDP-glucose 4-epimerase GalE [Candidatus Pelagibacter sp.]
MNVLITGGAGYIGAATSYLLLKKKINPIIIDKLIYKKNNIIPKKSIFFKSNISNLFLVKKIIKKYNINSVIHFAAYKDVAESILNPKKYNNNNYLITKKFIKCCKENGVNNFIFSSTAAVYGNISVNKNVVENSPLKPISIYGLTKKKIEDYLNRISDKNFKFFSLRYFNVVGSDKNLKYGPIGLKINSFTNNLYRSLITSKDFKIYGSNHKTKDGTPVRDFIHVDDLANIHYLSLKYLRKNKKNQICNCGYGKGYSIKEAVESIVRKKRFILNYSFTKKRPGDISYMVASTKKLNKIINWQPKYSNLEEMIFSEFRWKKKMNKK